MAEQVSFWQRVRKMFSGGDAEDHAGAATGVIRQAEADEDFVGSHELAPGGKSGWLRGGTAMQTRDVAQRVVALTDAMQEHFERQDQRSLELSRSLDRVGATLEGLAESQRAQTDFLRAIAAQTEVGTKNLSAMSDTIGRMPESLLTQAEAIRGVARQLEISQEADLQLKDSLHTFSRAVDALGTAGEAQVQTLQKLNTAQHEQQQAFTLLVQEQSKRFLIIIVVAALLGLAAIGALVVALALQLAG